MATEEQLDATCRRLENSRREILQLVHVLKGDRPLHEPREGFPRSHIMRALMGDQGRNVLGHAALALAISRPKAVWRLAGLAPMVRPMLVRFVVNRLLKPRKSASHSVTPAPN